MPIWEIVCICCLSFALVAFLCVSTVFIAAKFLFVIEELDDKRSERFTGKEANRDMEFGIPRFQFSSAPVIPPEVNHFKKGQEERRKFEATRKERALHNKEFKLGWHSLDNEYGECAPSPLPENGDSDKVTSV